jgi:molybdopterin-containing oxidoreductase family iron-sulfur binding subunit
MKQDKKYWKGLEELAETPEFLEYSQKEFAQDLPYNKGKLNDDGDGNSRRDFLKMMGFGIAAASLAACEAPVRKAIPYLNKPVDVDPGIPNYYATSFVSGGDFASVVVKTREGRPIKVEGNKLSNVTRGTKTPQVEASVLSLYDKHRFTGPMANGKASNWEELDKEIKGGLQSARNIRIISNSIISPSTKRAIEEFKSAYPGTEHVTYDAVSYDGMLNANEKSFGKRMIPTYRFDKAAVIVSFGADFLGTWISPSVYSHQYAQTRKLDDKKTMSRHFQFEANLSLTGSNADYRTPTRPSGEGLQVATLYNLLASKAGAPRLSLGEVTPVAHLNKAAEELWAARGKSLVVAGSNDQHIQLITNAINNLLSNYGSTINLEQPVNFRQGNDAGMNSFIDGVSSGNIDAVLFFNCNPVYDHPRGEELKAGLANVGVSVTLSDRADESSENVKYIAPDSHYLESWGDAEPVPGSFALLQPTISTLFNTREASLSLLRWSGNAVEDYFSYIKQNWQANIYANSGATIPFQTFWDKCLYDGIFELKANDTQTEEVSDFTGDIDGAARAISSTYAENNSGTELVVYQKIGLMDGRQANNPWLQELPDPITKATWDNYLTISLSMAEEMGIKMEEKNFTSVVTLTVNGKSVKLPVLVQPGQANGTVGLALGYGRTNAGRVADGVGVNVYPLLGSLNGTLSLVNFDVQVQKTEEKHQIAQTQTHQTYMGRDFVVQETVLSEYQKNPKAGRHEVKIATWLEEDGKRPADEISLWEGHEYPNHHWGMVIDMNSCTGCSNCLVACSAENNVPVVGKEEVLNRREMHWIRIDRYYTSSGDVEDKSISGLRKLEKPAENPEVVFQPMMCQHCNNAPCETVCPVAATTHSSEGLNQMTYNRCIGTRYCANNCPYKVRRFNWFKYHDNKQFPDNLAMNNDLGKMVLNPDVTVRARGVMEKCTLCVQRIQAGKLKAKLEKRRPIDSDINTACAEACPTDAILFGDMNDPNSAISKRLKLKEKDGDKKVQEERAFHVLPELRVSPNI